MPPMYKSSLPGNRHVPSRHHVTVCISRPVILGMALLHRPRMCMRYFYLMDRFASRQGPCTASHSIHICTPALPRILMFDQLCSWGLLPPCVNHLFQFEPDAHPSDTLSPNVNSSEQLRTINSAGTRRQQCLRRVGFPNWLRAYNRRLADRGFYSRQLDSIYASMVC